MSFFTFFSAFWLGVLTSISPCPLATNIAAVSFIGRRSGEKSHVIGSGLLYSLGRILAYVTLGIVITAGLMGSASVSRFLQRYMNEALGPLLILLGLILLGWIGSALSLHIGGGKLREKVKRGSILWALPIGALFALSFCPVSAALFFGALLPLALKEQSPLLLPLLYGVGSSLPVVVFAFIMAFSSNYLGKIFSRLSQIELWVRRLAGTAFILIGIYYCLTHIYGLVL